MALWDLPADNYTGIGSRETPADIRTLMTRIAAVLSARGWRLRSGAAPGADSAFERGAGGRVALMLPWPGFEGRGEHTPGSIFYPQPEAFAIAAKYHPVWERLKDGDRKMHARNVLQILGPTLARPSAFVLCWTPGARLVGGTSQAMRIATDYGVPLENLADAATLQRWMGCLRRPSDYDDAMNKVLVWWLSDSDQDVIGEARQGWPEYLQTEYTSRQGRAGRGRLWRADRFGGIGVHWPDPSTPLADVAERCGGIVIAAEDEHFLVDMPGLVTDLWLRRTGV